MHSTDMNPPEVSRFLRKPNIETKPPPRGHCPQALPSCKTSTSIFAKPRGLKDALLTASCLSKFGIAGKITTRCTRKGCRKKKIVRFNTNADSISILCVKRDFLSRLGQSARLDRQGTCYTSDLSAHTIRKAQSSKRVRSLADTGRKRVWPACASQRASPGQLARAFNSHLPPDDSDFESTRTPAWAAAIPVSQPQRESWISRKIG